MIADLKRDLIELAERLEELRVSLDIAGKVRAVNVLEEKTAEQGFWDNPVEAQKVMREINDLKDTVELYNTLKRQYDDVYTLWELGMEDDDPDEIEKEVARDIRHLRHNIEQAELTLLLGDKYDKGNAIISLHAGAGGTEAQDWVQMLLRMYTRWAEEKGYKIDTLDLLPGDEAGIKSASISIEGPYAYGYLKSEKGVHRLVRISPFDASGRRHTSFASVDVLPEVDDETEIVIDPADLRIDTFRSGGAGGQHVNKTDSAVRITHIPTGIVVQCQNERSQHSNRLKAMKLLQAKLLDLEIKKKEEELNKLRGEQQEIAWGSQIRSYVFHPYSLVKDHRTGVETGNVQAVMDGEIDEFIAAYLKSRIKRDNPA
ncbi:peptide chain release factor 2 [Thermincola ferriacetica]|uniref:peptide chain release factor 2 n=1 Tax=Thermincola ferriacetica TaxID=281456 RepID=UPI00128B1528|nr:peptide chain release factor 2 [Thermincola ferriacetica]